MRTAGLVLGLGLLLQAPIVRRRAVKPVEPNADETQQVPTIRVETRLVNIAVNVVDKTGAPVGGLKKEDFEIYERERSAE